MEKQLQLYKLIVCYDVDPTNMQEYYRFVMGRYVPTLQSLGLEMTEAWTTAWGNGPGRQIGFVARNLDTLYEVLDGETWDELNEELDEFVSDFDYKVVPYREGFQL